MNWFACRTIEAEVMEGGVHFHSGRIVQGKGNFGRRLQSLK
jgi:hypothetical protein